MIAHALAAARRSGAGGEPVLALFGLRRRLGLAPVYRGRRRLPVPADRPGHGGTGGDAARAGHRSGVGGPLPDHHLRRVLTYIELDAEETRKVAYGVGDLQPRRLRRGRAGRLAPGHRRPPEPARPAADALHAEPAPGAGQYRGALPRRGQRDRRLRGGQPPAALDVPAPVDYRLGGDAIDSVLFTVGLRLGRPRPPGGRSRAAWPPSWPAPPSMPSPSPSICATSTSTARRRSASARAATSSTG